MLPLYSDSVAARITGCWVGKNIGGTLGANTEGLAVPAELQFYTPVPTEPVPNDDLELQTFWAAALDTLPEPKIDRNVLAGLWLKHNFYPFDEYGVARRNLEAGVLPPHSGRLGNFFTDGLGGAIRSELWAVLAPGDPELASQYAYEDGCIDHTGNGLYAEIFCAALQSEAFVESNPKRLVEHALQRIPATLPLHRAIADTVRWCGESGAPRDVRARILDHYHNGNMTDVVMNLPFVVMALLLGGGDFEKSILMAVNCGYDTDCTGATVGATLGIMNPAGIPERWRAPVGETIAFSGFIHDLDMPGTLTELTRTVMRLRQRLAGTPPGTPPATEASALPVKFECSWIDWNDFRCDRFELRPAGWLETFGYCGRLELPNPYTEGVLSLSLRFRIRESKRYRVMFNIESWMRCFVDGKLVFCREPGTLMPAAHRTALNQFADLALGAGGHTLTVQTFRSEEKVTRAAFYFGIADIATYLWVPWDTENIPEDDHEA